MDLGLTGKVAVVAGGSRGLGRAVAATLAAEGAELVLAARDEATLQSAAAEIEAAHGHAPLAIPTDVTSEAAVGHLFESATKRFGRVDILVANAGGPPSTRFESTSVEAWKSGIELNLLSTIYLCRAAVPEMTRHGGGRIVAITSITVKQPVEGLILSNTARAGVAGFAKTLSNEVAADGIAVNVVCPGYTKTDRLVSLAEKMGEADGVPPEAIYDRWTSQIPMGRLGEPNEFADVVAFLCSDRASYVTGTCLQVDGGCVKSLL